MFQVSPTRLVLLCDYWVIEEERITAFMTDAFNSTFPFLLVDLFSYDQYLCCQVCWSDFHSSTGRQSEIVFSSMEQLPYQPMHWIKALDYTVQKQSETKKKQSP